MSGSPLNVGMGAALGGKAGHQLGKRSISAISDAYFDTSWRGDISWYLDYD